MFRIKHKPDDTIDKYKARLIAKGFHQQSGFDFRETFNLVVKPTIIHFVLTIAVQHHCPMRQLDVSNDFLHGDLDVPIYISNA